MIKEGYGMMPPQVREYTDPALESTVKYSKIGLDKAHQGYVQVADVIIEQYELHSPTAWLYWDKLKVQAGDASKVAMEHTGVILEHAQVLVRDFYDQVAPQAKIYFNTAKDFTVKYGKIGLSKSADLMLDGIDLAYDGYLSALPYLKQASDKTKEVLGPYVGPYIGKVL